MTYRTVPVLFVFALAPLALSATAGEKTDSPNAARFEALKKLAGDWVEVGKDGKPTTTVLTSIRVTAGGSAIHETIFPGTDKEMVTLYHLDGDDLILTHYCVLGNQPRLKAEPGKDAKRIAFKFSGGTNLKSPDDMHMHDATLILIDNDHFRAEWTACKDGKACHQAGFDFVRKAK
jgi:hypothetical protein